jgi:tetratricopeptide (TPR) repeat protein
MNQTWLSFPLRLLIAVLLLVLLMLAQFNFNLGDYYYMQGHTEQYVNHDDELALMNYQLSLKYRPENAATIYQSGMVLINLGQWEEATSKLESALNTGYEPRRRVLLPLVQLLRSLGREEEAAEYQAELEAAR